MKGLRTKALPSLMLSTVSPSGRHPGLIISTRLSKMSNLCLLYTSLSFDVPAVKVKDNIYSLELFNGPTLAFKDVGGRFMARLLGYFIKKEGRCV